MRKEWLLMVWCVVLLWGAVDGVLGQEEMEPEASGEVDLVEQEEGTQEPEEELEGGEIEQGIENTPGQGVFLGAWRVFREQQRHLTGSKEDASLPLGGILALSLVVYLLIVFGTLTFWRRSHTPTFRQQRLEQIQGVGRWTCTIAYATRRKLDAKIELRITRVEPEGTAAELACLVDDQIKGRISPDAAAFLEFPNLKPKSFWQKDEQEVIPLGFELIQPRDHNITLHIEGRVEYSIGSRKGHGGDIRQVLEFKPAKENSLLGPTAKDLRQGLAEGLTAEPVPFVDPQVMPLAAPVSVPGLEPSTRLADRAVADRAVEAANLAAERALATLDEFQRRRKELDLRMTTLEAKQKETADGGREGGVRGREIKSLEERLGSDLRENIQAVMEQVDDLRSEVASLRALVSDLAQRVT
jgi:hypothetical protein